MGTSIALLAALAAALSAMFVWLQVREMQRQTALQREVARGAAEPYVWADIRLNTENGWLMEFALGNSGKTTATNVRVVVDPPLPSHREDEVLEEVQRMLRSGVSSLPPGRVITWRLGPSPNLVAASEGPLAHRVTIDCDGPFGSLEQVQYVIDLADVRDSQAKRVGTPHEIADQVSKAIDKLTSALPGGRRPLPVEVITGEAAE